MMTMNDRERAFEAKFAHDDEVQFRIAARRNKLFGLWAAGRMGLTAEEADAYAVSVVQADFEEAGDEDVLRKVAADLTAADRGVADADLRAQLDTLLVEARRQFMESSAATSGR